LCLQQKQSIYNHLYKINRLEIRLRTQAGETSSRNLASHSGTSHPSRFRCSASDILRLSGRRPACDELEQRSSGCAVLGPTMAQAGRPRELSFRLPGRPCRSLAPLTNRPLAQSDSADRSFSHDTRTRTRNESLKNGPNNRRRSPSRPLNHQPSPLSAHADYSALHFPTSGRRPLARSTPVRHGLAL
jgi:hypothetical protein